LNKPLELQMGPDGALYVLNYSGYRTWNAKTGILRVEYHGDCHPVSTYGQALVVHLQVTLAAGLIKVADSGPHQVTVLSPAGKVEYQRKGDGAAGYDVRAVLGHGVHLIRVENSGTRFDGKMVL